MITQDELKSILTYDAASGEFRWLVRPSIGTPEGAVAGSVDAAKGYLRITIKRRRYLAHRLAWLYVYGRWPDREIDHINGDRADNRVANLRDAGQSINRLNARPRNRIPALRGVVQDRKKWRATGRKNGKYINIGSFDSVEDAIAARIKHEIEVYGEIACRDADRRRYPN